MDKRLECVVWILLVFMSPIAFLLLIPVALLSLLRFLFKAALLFSIVAIITPFTVMANTSMLVLGSWDSSLDPRITVGIELQTIVSDFFKVIASELLLVLSTGVITFYTAPLRVFYISMAVGVTAILLKWLNTSSLSKTAFSCICDGYGLNPMMFFFSFIGLFDIGCHPVAKCSFVASKAFMFIKKVRSGGDGWNKFDDEKKILSNNTRIEFSKWDVFEEGYYFHSNPRIDFIKRDNEKYILKSFVVLKLLGVNLCEYPMERLELPEDYSKANELYNFLVYLSSEDGFVTDKMRGRYEHSLTLLEIVDGVEESVGYRIVDPKDSMFIVAGCTHLQH